MENNELDVSEFFDGDDKVDIVTKFDRPVTKEELLQAASIDLKDWEVERIRINSWDAQQRGGEKIRMYQTRLSLKRILPLDSPMFLAAQKLVERLNGKYEGPVKSQYSSMSDSCMLEISPFDVHFGKLCWGPETDTDYDTKIAQNVFQFAFDDLLTKSACFNIDKILVPIGSDFLHINNTTNQTSSGNILDVDSRLPKIFEAAKYSLIKAIEKCLDIAPVEIIWVPGNHDRETSFYLMQVMSAWFRDCPYVTVDVTPKHRKYVRYGVNLIGFTHGDQERKDLLPTLMADECNKAGLYTPDLLYKEWHVGHLHKKGEIKYIPLDSQAGSRIRTIPSMCGTDAWHHMKGFIKGNPACEAYVWSRDKGYVCHYSVDVSHMLEDNEN